MGISKAAKSVLERASFPLVPRTFTFLNDIRIQARKKIKSSVESVINNSSVIITQEIISGVSCTCINPEIFLTKTKILYGFGGGFVSGSAYEDLTIAVPISEKLGATIIIPNYKLSPEFPWPNALNEAFDIYSSICEKPFMMLGESAGGNLILALAQKAQYEGLSMPRAIALISPWVDLSNIGDSLDFNDGLDPMLSKQHLDFAAKTYAPADKFSDPFVSPIHGTFTSDFPPTFISTGEKDLLRSQSERLNEILIESNANVELKIWGGMWHVFEWFPELPESNESLNLISEFMKKCDCDDQK